MKNCTDCNNWNPDDPDAGFCDRFEEDAVSEWLMLAESAIEEVLRLDKPIPVPDCATCPGFEEKK